MIILNKGYYFYTSKYQIKIQADEVLSAPVTVALEEPIEIFIDHGLTKFATAICYDNLGEGYIKVWLQDADGKDISTSYTGTSSFSSAYWAMRLTKQFASTDIIIKEYFNNCGLVFQGEEMPFPSYGCWQWSTISVTYINKLTHEKNEVKLPFKFSSNGENFSDFNYSLNNEPRFWCIDENNQIKAIPYSTTGDSYDLISWDSILNTFWISDIAIEELEVEGCIYPAMSLSYLLQCGNATLVDNTTYSVIKPNLPTGLTALNLNTSTATQYRLIKIIPQLQEGYKITSLEGLANGRAIEMTALKDGTYEFLMPAATVNLAVEVALDGTDPEPDPDPEEPGTGGGTDPEPDPNPEPEPEEPGGGGGDNPGTGDSGGNDDDNEDTKPYQGFAIATMFGQRLKSAGNYPLIRAQDVEMKDGTRLHDFNPLPPVGEEGMVLKVENGKWAAGWTIRAERDDEDSAILNIF